jgi:hypothetical protein
MRGGIFDHAEIRLWRCVRDELIGCFGWKRGWRGWCGHLSLRLFFEFDQAPADDQTIEDHPDPDQEWNYTGHPYAANDLRFVRGGLVRDNAEEEAEEDHDADPDRAGDDAVLDLSEPFHFGRDPTSSFQLLFGEDHISQPCLAPIELLRVGAGRNRIAHTVQVRAALPAEFEIIADVQTASGTEHSNSSINRLEFRLQAVLLGYQVVPPEGGTPNDLRCFRGSHSDPL